MIEIVYDEANEMMRSSDRVKYELPKNIRQVGNAPGNYKIYVEDYVMTYLRRIASPGNMNCRGAILLGKVYDENGTKVIFVSGAVDVPGELGRALCGGDRHGHHEEKPN